MLAFRPWAWRTEPEHGRAASVEQTAANLQRALEQAHAIIDLQRRIQQVGHDLDAVMQLVVDTAMTMTAATGAVVEILEGDEMVYRAVAGLASASGGLRLAAPGSLSGLCVRERTALRSDDTSVDDRVDQAACQRVGARSMICVPLLDGDRCHGVLKVYAGVVAAFDDGVVTLLEQLASFIAVALRNAGDYADREREATHDALTGLPNRACVLERLTAALSDARRRAQPVCVAFVDLDGLKTVNDTAGHAAGDAFIVAAATRLRAAVREGDTVARIGGDEFVAVCPGSDGYDAERVRERLVSALSTHPAVAASVGVVASRRGEDADTLLARADEAMYACKQARR